MKRSLQNLFLSFDPFGIENKRDVIYQIHKKNYSYPNVKIDFHEFKYSSTLYRTLS